MGEKIGEARAIDTETGESLIDIAEQHFKHKIKGLEDIGDRNGLLEFKQNYPGNEDDAFLRITSSPFPIEELLHQRRLLKQTKTYKRLLQGAT